MKNIDDLDKITDKVRKEICYNEKSKCCNKSYDQIGCCKRQHTLPDKNFAKCCSKLGDEYNKFECCRNIKDDELKKKCCGSAVKPYTKDVEYDIKKIKDLDDNIGYNMVKKKGDKDYDGQWLNYMKTCLNDDNYSPNT